MGTASIALLLSLCLLTACARSPDSRTLAELRKVEPDLAEMQIDDGIERAMVGYRKFLAEAPRSTLTPEAMRRLADLQLEKKFGLLSQPDRGERPVPEIAQTSAEHSAPASLADASRSIDAQRDLERRATGDGSVAYAGAAQDLELPGGHTEPSAGPLEAIELYDQILEAYPDYPNNDRVLYQKARAYDELGRNDEAIAVTAILVSKYPESAHIDEVQFRRAEYFFTRKKYLEAEEAYGAIVARGSGSESEYYEFALYKLGWTLYKQMLLEEALERYITLLDYKVSLAYDFDQTEDDAERSRIADTYRVISLCFSDLGGTESVGQFFSAVGPRSYEHRIYRKLGEFYLEKLRYADAASAYEAFVDLYPYHDVSPHFSMRVVEIYEAGDFPMLVLEAKKAFAADYGLQSEYWTHFEIGESPEVVSHLKQNLKDLANHYHALYQSEERLEDKPAHFSEGTRWYRAYLASFSSDSEAPAIHYQLADLYLENQDFGVAALEYEQIAYEYPGHAKASSAGYAAVFAHRQHQKSVAEHEIETVRLQAVASTLRFVDHFPDHEHAATVLAAATEDLYALQDFENAIANGQRLIREYPDADPAIVRAAWNVVAHSSFDTLDFEQAEAAYSRVLEMTSSEDEARRSVVDNLAAAIYKQGENANQADDYRAAAEHFLRIAQLAPGSTIRPNAEYDAGTALIQLEDWSAAAQVFESFRESFPDHELSGEATRQIAFVYLEDGNPARAAQEYERVAAEAIEPELRREALLVAGGLYEEAQLTDRALGVYREYVSVFAAPIEPAVVTRFKMAEIYKDRGDRAKQEAELSRIIAIDAAAGAERSDVIRVTAARSALILTEKLFRSFDEVELSQPFEANLQKKQRRMDIALAGFEKLIDYEVGEVTSAATFYMAEVFGDFSRSLLESERPGDLTGTDLQDYEMVLEEEAYPFEERAIEVHEKNLELMAAGVFSEWIEKSLAELAIVMPGRYAKFESSSGLIESIDSYAYRTPSSEARPELEKTAEQIMASRTSDSDEASSGEAALETIPENVEAPADMTPAQGSPPAAPDPAADAGPAATPDPGEPASADEPTPGETIDEEVEHAAID